MPHPGKKKPTSRQKAVSRQRRSRQRKREKDEFEELQYLNSQLDENGQPLDILNTDERLLNNEQKFISRIIKRLRLIDLHSIAVFIDENYDEDIISELVTNYYLNKENKTWSDTFFKITYRCLGFLNLNDLLTNKIFEYVSDIIEHVKPTDKPNMTEELLEDIIDECHEGLPNLNSSELINNFLLLYSQNAEYCLLPEQDILDGGTPSDNFYRFLENVGQFITFFWFLVWCINNAPDSSRRPRAKKTSGKSGRR